MRTIAGQALRFGPPSGFAGYGAYGAAHRSLSTMLAGFGCVFLYGIIYEPLREVLMRAAPKIGTALGDAVSERLRRWGDRADRHGPDPRAKVAAAQPRLGPADIGFVPTARSIREPE
jgi:hypothetical protein